MLGRLSMSSVSMTGVSFFDIMTGRLWSLEPVRGKEDPYSLGLAQVGYGKRKTL
jgi:hypothetical protein